MSCPTCGQNNPTIPPDNAATTSATSWNYNLTVDGYVVPHGQSYVDPVFSADHGWLHLEARYNWENLYTGSLWVGRNFSWGKTVEVNLTPMIGGVMGRTDGIAPGLEAALKYKKLSLSVTNEYVFDTSTKSGNFYSSYPQIAYAVTDWLRCGAVAMKNKAFQTKLQVQRGFFVGLSHKNWEFTTYIYNPGVADPTVVLEVGRSF